MDTLAQEIIFIVSISAFFLVVAVGIISLILVYQNRQFQYFKEKKDMQNNFAHEILKMQLETQEQTFHQISAEIHDNIGQLLSSSKMLFNVAKLNLKDVPDVFNTAEETLGKAIQDLRLMSKSLNKNWLHQFNIIDNLYTELERTNAAQTIHAELKTDTSFLPLAAEEQVMLFRIIQEALQNSIKHAQPKHIAIEISCAENIEVMIEDDGKGFDAKMQHQNGVGLMNMQHRTKLLGGNIKWISQPAAGTKVQITIPAENKNVYT